MRRAWTYDFVPRLARDISLFVRGRFRQYCTARETLRCRSRAWHQNAHIMGTTAMLDSGDTVRGFGETARYVPTRRVVHVQCDGNLD